MSYDRRDILFSFKTVICGASSVGKTCLFNRYCFNSFNFDTSPTIGLNFHSIHLKIDLKEEPEEKYSQSHQNTLQMKDPSSEGFLINSIFDFGGQERFKPLIPKFIEGANGALLVFDSVSQISFNKLEFWYEQLTESTGNSKIPIILVASKSDLLDKVPETEIISDEVIHKFMKEKQLDGFYRTSALENFNVLVVFKELNNLMLKRQQMPYVLT